MIMRRASVLLLASLLLASCSFGKGVGPANRSVDQFHRMLDAGRFAEIYEASDPLFKKASKQTEFVRVLEVVHRKLGNFKSGSTVGWNDNVNASGEFVTLNYKSVYASGDAQEQFVFRITNDGADLVGFNINSAALILN